MDEKAIKEKKRKYWKMSRNHNFLSTIIFLFSVCLLFAAVFLVCHVFGLLMMNSLIESEYVNARNTITYYENNCESETDPYEIFDISCGDYYIKDAEGNIVRSQGEDTCSDKYGYIDIPGEKSNYSASELMPGKEDVRLKIYEDKNVKVINTDDEGVDLDFAALIGLVNDSGMTYDKVLFSKEKVALVRIHIPAWLELDMNKSGQTLYYKADMSISPSSLVMLFIIFTLTGVASTVITLGFIIYAIVSALNQRRMNRMFFSDIKTQGHNWLWFWFVAGHKLGHIGAAEQEYALVDIKFMDYRHYCICHSVDEGEQLLIKIYGVLQEMVGKKELCAVSAEDRFALLLEVTDTESLKMRIDDLLDKLGKIGGDRGFVFHAGIVMVEKEEGGLLKRRENVDITGLYNNACAACMSVEQTEGNAIAFYDEKLIEEQKWIDTVGELQQKALDNEEFVVFYQPKYDPKTNELRGAEALIRWQSPEYGFLSPGRFIPIFEKNGFITHIDHYMIKHVARDQKKWLDEGLNCVPVSVNVSRAHFIESDLAEQIRDMVDKEGLPHELIEIELTESAFFDDKKAMITTIHKLKDYGFMVSMDDFGAGYSSLNSLKDMPLDVLKLDADFFHSAAEDKERGDIVISEAIKMAKSLKMRTVAEGVEHKEQVRFLADNGCDMIQGYFYAKPMPGDDYVQRMIQGVNEGEEQ